MAQRKSFFIIILPIIVCATAASFYVYDYILRVSPSAMTAQLMTDLNIRAAGLGLLSSLFFYGYAPMQIPAGYLYDRFSPRLILTVTIGLSALAAIAFGLSNHYGLVLASRLLMGLTTAFAYIGALVIGSRWISPKHFATYSGVVQFFGSMGAIIGQGPIALLTHHYGWHAAAFFIGGLGVILTILMWTLVRDYPKDFAHTEPTLKANSSKFRFEVFRNGQNWWAALYAFAIWAPIVVFANLWGVTFLHETYNFSLVKAASFISAIWIGTAVGGPLIGWWSGHIEKRLMPMLSAALVGFVVSVVIIYIPHLSDWTLLSLLSIFGVAASAMVLSFGYINDINSRENIGTAVGFNNMAVIASGVLLQPLAGVILEWLWSGKLVNGMPQHTPYEYRIAMLMVPLTFLLATIVPIFMKETHCKNQ